MSQRASEAGSKFGEQPRIDHVSSKYRFSVRSSVKSTCFAVSCFCLVLTFHNLCGATTIPIVTVLSPESEASSNANSSSFEGDSPVHYVAYATSADCVSGIATMKIYTGNGIVGYETHSSYLDVQLPLAAGVYHTGVKAWDNCGGISL
ncbi:MAG TPA: hypothetical protein VGF44_13565 [Terriglobales bacterium]